MRMYPLKRLSVERPPRTAGRRGGGGKGGRWREQGGGGGKGGKKERRWPRKKAGRREGDGKGRGGEPRRRQSEKAGRGPEEAAAPGAQSCLRVQRRVRRQGQVEAADRGAGGDAHRRGRRRARAHGRQRRDPSAGAASQPQRRRQARSTQCPARCCLATSPQLRFAGAVRVIANRRVEVARHRAAGFRRPGRVGGGCQAPRAAQPCLPPPPRRCRISPGRQP